MNRAVGPIFNEKIAEKWNLWVREKCIGALFTVKKSTNVGKKKKKTAKQKCKHHNNLNPNEYIVNLVNLAILSRCFECTRCEPNFQKAVKARGNHHSHQ